VTTPTPEAYFAFRDAIATGNPQDARRFIEAYPQGILAEIVRVHLLGDGARLPQLVADAERGDVAAQLVLSELHSTGWGVEKHIDRAIAYAEDAARDGQAFARYQLAALLLAQVPDDLPAGTRVAQLLEGAANAGVFLAQTLLGNLLFTGRLEGGAAVDRAIERFAQAAAQGDRNALFNLGLIYDGGLGGVTPDSTRAQGYFRQAAALGHRNALNYLP
jgi:TPR repeat protein